MTCQCDAVNALLRRHGHCEPGTPARCAACVDAVLGAKNEAVRELARLRGIIDGLTARVASQSDQLSRLAEKKA